MSEATILTVIKIFTGLIAFASVLFLTYVTTRFIGQKTAMTMRNKHMKVIETLSLGVDKTIYLIHVGDKSILVSVSGKNIRYMTDVQIDHTEESIENTGKRMDFSNIFMKYINRQNGQDDGEPKQGYVSGNVEKIKKSLNRLDTNRKGGEENLDEQ